MAGTRKPHLYLSEAHRPFAGLPSRSKVDSPPDPARPFVTGRRRRVYWLIEPTSGFAEERKTVGF